MITSELSFRLWLFTILLFGVGSATSVAIVLSGFEAYGGMDKSRIAIEVAVGMTTGLVVATVVTLTVRIE